MKNNRIHDHPILGSLSNQKEIKFTFDGKEYRGYEGDTIASALLANGIRTLRKHEESGIPRGIYCNIGHCYECRLTVDHTPGVRACLTPISENMNIQSGQPYENPFKKIRMKDDLPRTYAEFLKRKQKKNEEDHYV